MQQFSIPDLQGHKPKGKQIIYVSCDDKYFTQHVFPLVRSIIFQIDWIHVHVHVVTYHDVPEMINHPRVSFTWEKIDKDFIDSISLNKKTFSDNKKIHDLTDPYQIKEKIYFSCARFLRLIELFQEHQFVLQIDADTILNNPFTREDFLRLTTLPRGMRKPKDPNTIIASCISLGTGPEGKNFRKKFNNLLLSEFDKGAYWFMDQICLREAFKGIEFVTISQRWCSWGIKKRDIFSTAKGKKKNKPRYLEKVAKWRI